MRTVDPGHVYIPEWYPAEEKDGILNSWPTTIQFRKRIGPGYPGNDGRSKDGTSTQELQRIIIARILYVDSQEPHIANKITIHGARISIYEMELRATDRRGAEYKKRWREDYENWRSAGRFGNEIPPVEEIPPCSICGHIFCRKHK